MACYHHSPGSRTDRTHGLVTLVHASRVEVHEHFFIEGSGTGCFSSANSGRPIAYLAQAASLPTTPFASCPAPPQPITCSMDEDGKHVTVSNARIYT